MELLKRKSKLTAIAFVLMLTISAILVAIPAVTGHDPAWEIPTWAFISVSPNPIGIGQDALLVFWVNDYPITANGAYGDRWDGFTVEVTAPDGTKEILGPFRSDPVGAGWTLYNPTQIGTYTFVFSFPGDTITNENPNPTGAISGGAYIGDHYLPSTSDPITLTVTQEPVLPYQETPLPEGYWTRPISGINREWYKISGNWLNAGDNPNNWNRYSDGPGSSHIMWAKPYWDGGIMGGQFGTIGYYTGRSYETFGSPLIIVNGRLYYNVQYPPRYGWYAVDLRTGEELYFRNTTGAIDFLRDESTFPFDYSGDVDTGKLTFGQIYDYESPNQHGGFPYLWSAWQSSGYPEPRDWMMFDAFTGNYICSISNVSASGTRVYGKDGSILYYRINNGRLTVWNNTYAIWYEDEFSSNDYWMWRPDLNATYDGNNGFSLNVSVPEDLTGSIRQIIEGEYIIGGTSGQNDKDGLEEGIMWAISLEKGKEGILLWNKTFTPPYNIIGGTGGGGVFGYGQVSGPTVDVENRIFYFESQLERKVWVYDLDTMQLLWESDAGPSFNYYNMYQSVAYGKLINYGMGGIVECYDIRTGELLWTYTSGTLGFETAYENTPLQLAAIADEKIFLYSDEHSPTMPLARGRGLRAVDLNTGEELWEIHHWGVDFALADGYLVGLNLYDNQFYCYGKGPSETTVTAPDMSAPLGATIMIRGTVTDQSAGAKGTPAIADEYMNEWMEYLYMQRPMPCDAQGVEVKLTAIDPNGNYQEIGEATSDISGNFGISWIPPVPGEYHVTAEFEGSESYGGSFDTTYFVVETAPSVATSMEPEPTEPTPTVSEPTEPTPTMPEPTVPAETTETALITTETAIIAAVVAVACITGAVAFWQLRKRK
jgi:hypothetical protein